jgi:hypothetical protein
MKDEPALEPTRGTIIAGVGALVATHVYFALFVAGALDELASAVTADVFAVRRVWIGWTLGLVIGGWIAAKKFNLVALPGRLGNMFRAAGAATCLTTVAWSSGVLLAMAVVAGLAGGVLWVTVVTGLRAALGGRRLGLVVGAGVGLTALLVQAPLLADLSGRAQGLVTAVLVALGSLTVPWLTPQEPAVATERDWRWFGMAAWTAALGALVALGAAVYWNFGYAGSAEGETVAVSAAQRLARAGAVLGAALLAGAVLDRGRVGWTGAALAVVGLLAWGATGNAWGLALGGAGLVVLLVALPVIGGHAWQAGQILGVAVGGGLAAGSGLVVVAGRVPGWSVIAALIVVAAVQVWRHRPDPQKAV